MIQITRTKVYGFEEAVRGMRNSHESWDKSDSYNVFEDAKKYCTSETSALLDAILGPSRSIGDEYSDVVADNWRLGDRDRILMNTLFDGGDSHAKYQRFITVSCDICAPLYWWKEFDTYKIGVDCNSTSTMHSIMKGPFSIDQFSTDQMLEVGLAAMDDVVMALNDIRNRYIECEDDTIKKQLWYTIIQLLPTSWNQLRTIKFNYQVLSRIKEQRRGHRLKEWADFIKWIDTLPYANEIIG